MSAFSAMTRSVMSRRFSSISGLASWFGNVPSISKHSVVSFLGDVLEQQRRDQAGHAAAGIEHDIERLEDRQIDERQDVFDVVVDDVRLRQAAGRRRRRRQLVRRRSCRGCRRCRTRRDSGNASFRTILMPLYSLGLCEAVIWTPPSWPSRATAK